MVVAALHHDELFVVSQAGWQPVRPPVWQLDGLTELFDELLFGTAKTVAGMGPRGPEEPELRLRLKRRSVVGLGNIEPGAREAPAVHATTRPVATHLDDDEDVEERPGEPEQDDEDGQEGDHWCSKV